MTEATTAPAMDLLLRFCGDKESRYALTAPWIRDGWRYATDGRLCVRMPAEGLQDTAAVYIPPAGEVFAINFEPYADKCRKPWPDLMQIVMYDGTCPQCDGFGELGCSECFKRTCLTCHGKKTTKQEHFAHVGNHAVRPVYARKIADLPGVRWAAGIASNKPLPFVFDGGGQGLVMGMPDVIVNE